MPKNIVLLSDGTGNSAAKLSKTNVWRLYQALDLSKPDEQIAYYDDGVGTSSFVPLAILGGAFGFGVKRNVLDLYTFVCRNYTEGDRIYCFGFSRGAFTARMVAGLIASEGLVQAATHEQLQKRAKTAYREYRREHFPADIPIDRLGRWIRDLFVGDANYNIQRECPHIHFLGLWDTVTAYGLPIDEMTRALNWFWRLYPKDRNLNPGFDRVCHAVGLDDERYTFHPMLFNEADQPQDKESIDKERLTQVWFAGMHSNVGGGYPDDGLSYVPLAWMMDQAQKSGLIISRRDRVSIMAGANPVGTIYDSRQGLGGLYRYMPRKLLSFYQLPEPGKAPTRPGTALTYDTLTPVLVPRPKIHESVFQRIDKSTNRYSPIVFPAFYAVVRRNGAIVSQQDVLEHPTQAESRVHEQERVWNVVWWKRVVYFATILVALALLAFPLLFPPSGACAWVFCSISPAIGVLAAVLPNFAGAWITAFQNHPGIFLAMALILSGLLIISNRLQQKIFDRMHFIWDQRVRQPRTPVPVVAPPSDALFDTRSKPLYDRFFIRMKFKLLPATFLVVSLLAIAGLVSRGLFNALSSAGAFCSEKSLLAHSVDDRFPTRSVCWAVPTQDKNGNIATFNVQKGKRYVIHLKIADKKHYMDSTIGAGLGGFGRSEMPWTFRTFVQPIAVFIRREPFENWFKPIIRIGNRGTEEYPLNPSDGSEATATTSVMSSSIVPGQTGPLYLFVNDGVLPMPVAWWPPKLRFYDNNHGEILVSVCTTGVVPAKPGDQSDARPESGCICNNSVTKEAAPGRNCL